MKDNLHKAKEGTVLYNKMRDIFHTEKMRKNCITNQTTDRYLHETKRSDEFHKHKKENEGQNS